MNTTDEKILDLLRGKGDFVSGEAICRQFAVTRAAVWKHIKALKEAGYDIESTRGSGYRLTSAPNIPYACEVRNLLTTKVLGQAVKYLPSTDSTNTRMVALAGEGAPDGMVLVADHQTGGRGRMTRQWFSPQGVNLYFSLLLRPDITPVRAPQLSLVAGLALARAVETICPGLQPTVKWPNDVFLNGRKLSGILCDMRAEVDRVHYLVIGIGINVNVGLDAFPEELQGMVSSLRHAYQSLQNVPAGQPGDCQATGRPEKNIVQASGPELSRAGVLAAFLNQMEPLYQVWLKDGLEALLPDLETRSYQQGMEVRVTTTGEPVTGTAIGFSANGGLLIDCGEAVPREIICGDVLPVEKNRQKE